MRLFDTEIAPLGMGCWPIGGAMFAGPGFGASGSIGYSNADDTESIRTIHAAMANGVTLFDTAAVYGAGHAERLLAKALKGYPDAIIVTKIGMAMDEGKKMVLGMETDPSSVPVAIDRCLARLERERIDILLLHLNDFPVTEAEPLFDAMEHAVRVGKIRSYGWSTDFSQSVRAVSHRKNFIAVEHGMNVFFDAPAMRTAVHDNALISLIRSPLGMGVLAGKYDENSQLPLSDIRAAGNTVTEYFKDGRPNPHFLKKLEAVRDMLQIDGRTLVQGALAWLWAKSGNAIPVPGARTVDQIEGIAGALRFGPLPTSVVREIDDLIGQGNEGADDRPR